MKRQCLECTYWNNNPSGPASAGFFWFWKVLLPKVVCGLLRLSIAKSMGSFKGRLKTAWLVIPHYIVSADGGRKQCQIEFYVLNVMAKEEPPALHVVALAKHQS
jgi:hypothetical protein